MTTQPTEEQKYAALQRFIAEWKPGLPWQYRQWGSLDWHEPHYTSDIGCHWASGEYRIPPAPKIEPWDFKTAPELTMRVRRKEGKRELVRASMYPVGVFVAYSQCDYSLVTYAQFATDFEQLNGKPCGKEATV